MKSTFDKQLEILRAMTPAQKWRAAILLYWSARSLKVAFLRRQHPDWTPQMLQAEVNRLFSFADE